MGEETYKPLHSLHHDADKRSKWNFLERPNAVTIFLVLCVFSWLYVGMEHLLLIKRTDIFKYKVVENSWIFNRTKHIDMQSKTVVFQPMSSRHEDLVLKVTRGQRNFIAQDDPDLLWYIGQSLVGPSPNPHFHKHIRNRSDYSGQGQSKVIDSLLNHKTGGLFLEVGSSQGAYLSNTLFFEKYRSWTGLLIEPEPEQYHASLVFRRNATSLNVCVSPQNQTHNMRLKLNQEHSLIKGPWSEKYKRDKNSLKVECFPLYSILLATEIRHIDYFSLDVSGQELDILHTIPFGYVTIETFTVAIASPLTVSQQQKTQKFKEIKRFFSETGMYEFKGVLPGNDDNKPASISSVTDAVFMRI